MVIIAQSLCLNGDYPKYLGIVFSGLFNFFIDDTIPYQTFAFIVQKIKKTYFNFTIENLDTKSSFCSNPNL